MAYIEPEFIKEMTKSLTRTSNLPFEDKVDVATQVYGEMVSVSLDTFLYFVLYGIGSNGKLFTKGLTDKEFLFIKKVLGEENGYLTKQSLLDDANAWINNDKDHWMLMNRVKQVQNANVKDLAMEIYMVSSVIDDPVDSRKAELACLLFKVLNA